MDFKFVNLDGVVVARADSARQAQAMLQADHGLSAGHILLDDTGIEISEAELGVFCSAEMARTGPES